MPGYWRTAKGRSTTWQSWNSMRAVISVTHSVEINRLIPPEIPSTRSMGGQWILSLVSALDRALRTTRQENLQHDRSRDCVVSRRHIARARSHAGCLPPPPDGAPTDELYKWIVADFFMQFCKSAGDPASMHARAIDAADFILSNFPKERENMRPHIERALGRGLTETRSAPASCRRNAFRRVIWGRQRSRFRALRAKHAR